LEHVAIEDIKKDCKKKIYNTEPISDTTNGK
jgi:hypothetical protein